VGVVCVPQDERGGSGEQRHETAWYRVDLARGCAVITAGGEIDTETAPGLHYAVTKAATMSSRLVIDFSELDFIDSTGLGVLIVARNHAQTHGGSVSLVSPPPLVRRLLGATRLQQVFSIYDRLDEALVALTPQ
jgi:anti-sigma B factor antagonist